MRRLYTASAYTLATALKGIRDLRHLKGGLIFGRRRDGGPLSLYAVRERLERACRKAGLNKFSLQSR